MSDPAKFDSAAAELEAWANALASSIQSYVQQAAEFIHGRQVFDDCARVKSPPRSYASAIFGQS